MIPVAETDAQKERRLLNEAQTVCFGTLLHETFQEAGVAPSASLVRVEFTYQETEDTPEHCAYWLVAVPSYEIDELDQREALEKHPATLAADRVAAWSETRAFAYFSIDDTYPA